MHEFLRKGVFYCSAKSFQFFPISTNKNDLLSKIAKLNGDRESNKEKDTDINSFFKEKFNSTITNTNVNLAETQKPVKEEKVENKPTKISLNDLINKKREELKDSEDPKK